MAEPTTPEFEKVGAYGASVTHNITYHIAGYYPRLFDKPTVEFLNLVLESAFIPNAKILSTLLITLPSLGKTTYLQLTENLDFVKYTNDISPKPLMEFLDDVEKGRKKFLVIPDYINTLAHGKNTVENTRSILRSMIEEGYTSSDYYGMQREYDHPVKAGLISGITVEKVNENTGRWRADGFYSRLLPWSYSHSLPTSESIVKDKLDGAKPIRDIRFKINKNPTEPTLDELMKEKVKNLSLQLIQDKYVGAIYRPLEQVLSLVKGSAVLRDSKKVEQEDISHVMGLSVYINRHQNPI